MKILTNWQVTRNDTEQLSAKKRDFFSKRLAADMELNCAEEILSQIDRIIHRVAGNQLSTGQGWREVKLIMQVRNSSQEDML